MADHLTQAYERLREAVVSGQGTAAGVAVVLHQGLVGWADVCTSLMPSSRPSARNEDCGVTVQPAVVAVMAQMLWARWEEGNP